MKYAAALLVLLAILAGCGGGGGGDQADPAPTTAAGLTEHERQVISTFQTDALLWCGDVKGDDPNLSAFEVVSVLADHPDALLDDGSGQTVAEALAVAADDVRPCEPGLAANLDLVAP